MMTNPSFAIWGRDVRVALRAPSAWTVFAATAALAGVLFAAALRARAGSEGTVVALFCTRLALAVPFAAAFFTMGLFARERQRGTLETLLTAPVTDAEAVVGKFLGAYTLTILATACACLSFAVYVRMASPPPPWSLQHLLAGTGALALGAAARCAFGVLASVAARNERAAGAVTLLFGLGNAAFAAGLFPGVRLAETAPAADLLCFASGFGDTRPVFACLSAAALFLFAAVRLLESRRWTGISE